MSTVTRLSLLALATASLSVALPACAQDAETPQKTFELGANWTGDLIGNVSGGVRRGGLMLHNLDLTAAWHGENGWEAFGYVVGDANGGFSGKYVGDAQAVSNIDATPGVRLFEAWVKKTSADQSMSATFGLINLNGMFDVQDVGGLFLHSSHGMGPDYSQAGPSIFPITALGALSEWHPSEHLTLRAAVFDAVAGDANDDTRFAYIRVAKDEGVQWLGEVQYDFDGGAVKLGHWANTLAAPTLDGMGTHRMAGTYGQVQFTLTTEKDKADQGLKGWVRAGQADDKTLAIDAYAGGGLVYTGPLPGRDEDMVGISVASAHFGKPYEATVSGPVSNETTWEISYQAAIRPGFSVQPDVQYVVHPGGDPSVKNAVVVGVRFKLDLMGL